ncbi:class I lanthipeptide [Hymenobacter persicinus]|uniref:class I lanthipeptide n=1 Tax=Hymenobacter persicinus TaxID=2025506 RepID=UPI0013EAAD0A|nr:class I lanthipeptide [Hymenobacter persicinus]
MKKVTVKLTLNKQTLASLDQKQLAAAKGGFTYSISWGSLCRHSRQEGAGSRDECLGE